MDKLKKLITPNSYKLSAILAITGIALCFVWVWFIRTYTVNIFFLDQWNFLDPVIKEKGLWKVFSKLNGPHRQGIGGILQYILYPLSDWNIAWESYISVFFLVLSAILALLIKKKLSNGLSFYDLCIPFIFLTVQFYESILVAVNISHGVLPVFFFLLNAYVMICLQAKYQGPILALLVLFTTYTGFAIFSSVLIIPYLFLRWYKTRHSVDHQFSLKWALAASFFGISFLYQYRMEPAVLCFTFPHEYPLEYLIFIINMINSTIGLQYLKQQVSENIYYVLIFIPTVLIFLTWLNLLVRNWKSKFDSPTSLALLYLMSVSFIFYAFTAVGRVCLGPDAAATPRYLIYSAPVFYVIFILLDWKIKSSLLKNIFFSSAIALLAIKEVVLCNNLPEKLEYYNQIKLTWKQCYMDTKSISECNTKSGTVVVFDALFTQKSLKIMEKKQIHFFKVEPIN